MQCGGWTITWQGTGTTNNDFPHGESIWHGIAQAVHAAGGEAELSPDGAYKAKPDVAIVVYGEKPYAEFQGDVPNLAFSPGDDSDLALLRRLHAAGIPVVSVFISGRPLWVNPQLNASNAFIAAWLPGSEGGGIADVLFRRPDGAIRYDFRGKLAFSWPRTPLQFGTDTARAAALRARLWPAGCEPWRAGATPGDLGPALCRAGRQQDVFRRPAAPAPAGTGRSPTMPARAQWRAASAHPAAAG